MPNTERKLFEVDLQLFNEGGAEGAEGSGVTTDNAPKVDNVSSGSDRHSKKGEYENVVFGKQGSTTNEETTSLDTKGIPMGAGETNTLEAKRKAFDEMINGDYKEIYEEKFQQVFNRRFKEVKGIEAELASHKEIVDMLKGRYGVNDVADVKKAITEDYSLWEELAEENGMTVEQYLAVERLKKENSELIKFKEHQAAIKKAQEQVEVWRQEEVNIKGIYPDFNLNIEFQNEDFRDLLKKGVSMQRAYEVIHHNELTQNAARVAAQTADAQAQARIKSKASRPSENGISSKTALITKSDVNSLTDKDILEVARQAFGGKKISF